MRCDGSRGGRRAVASASTLAVATSCGCSPELNVLGVYFPAWLVSSIVGLVVAYPVVLWLARRPRTRALGQTGLFFCGLAVSVALAVWWIFFSGF